MLVDTQRITIKTCIRIFDNKQRDFLIACLKLFKNHEQFSIEMTSAREADIILVCPSEPGVINQVSSLTEKMNKIVIVYSNDNNTSSPWSLERPAKKESLNTLLTKILPIVVKNRTGKADFAANKSESPISTIAQEVMDKYQTYFSSGSYFQFTINGNDVYFDAKRKVFLVVNDLDITQLTLQSMRGITPQEKLPEYLNDIANLKESKWNSLCLEANTRSMTYAFDSNKKYNLTEWPNFKNIKHCHNDILLSRFFLRYNSSISDASQKLDIDRSIIENYCSISLLSGYLSDEVTSFKEVKQTDYPVSKKIIHSIFKVLRKEAQ
jgi:hypothetical protein